MNKIVKKEVLANNIKRFQVEAPLVARKALPGQFVVLRVDEDGERIPLTIAGTDSQAGTISIIFQEVGTSTMKLGLLQEGESIANLAGPLGKPVEIQHFGQVCIVAGGVGAAFVFWMAQSFKAKNNRLVTILGARSQNLLVLEDELRAISDLFLLTTDDGTRGEKGLVTQPLERLLKKGEKIDYVLTAGPIPMMKNVAKITAFHRIKTIASLNPIMVDGTGMCGCCRVTVGGRVRFACVDGPDFDAHQVDFDELLRRNSLYRQYEEISKQRFHECRLKKIT